MKKLILIPALLSTMLLADKKQFEVSALIGHNFTESNLQYNDGSDFNLFGGESHLVYAGELQYNYENSNWSPEFAFQFANNVHSNVGVDSDIRRWALNGVYTWNQGRTVQTFVKAGLGYESWEYYNDVNKNGVFIDAGLGAKVFFTDNIAFKAEGVYAGKDASHNAGYLDNTFAILFGLTVAFGDYEKEEVVVVEEEEEVYIAPAPVDGDDDNDGVSNSKDKCPNTEAGAVVDGTGCNVDLDRDGVLNINDICPNTPRGAEVNNDGCPKTVNLHINFDFASARIAEESKEQITKYATFLKTYTNYSARIVGHADNVGTPARNLMWSSRRANAVKNALIAEGVNPSQLSAVGKGDTEPVASNATAEGRAENRRIEAELTRH